MERYRVSLNHMIELLFARKLGMLLWSRLLNLKINKLFLPSVWGILPHKFFWSGGELCCCHPWSNFTSKLWSLACDSTCIKNIRTQALLLFFKSYQSQLHLMLPAFLYISFLGNAPLKFIFWSYYLRLHDCSLGFFFQLVLTVVCGQYWINLGLVAFWFDTSNVIFVQLIWLKQILVHLCFF